MNITNSLLLLTLYLTGSNNGPAVNEEFDSIWNDDVKIRERLNPTAEEFDPSKTYALLSRLVELGKSTFVERELIGMHDHDEHHCNAIQYYKMDKILRDYKNRLGPLAAYVKYQYLDRKKFCDKVYLKQMKEAINEELSEEQSLEIRNLVDKFQNCDQQINQINVQISESCFQIGNFAFLVQKYIVKLEEDIMLKPKTGQEIFKKMFDENVIKLCNDVQSSLRRPMTIHLPEIEKNRNFILEEQTDKDFLLDWIMYYRTCKQIIDWPDSAKLVYSYYYYTYGGHLKRNVAKGLLRKFHDKEIIKNF